MECSGWSFLGGYGISNRSRNIVSWPMFFGIMLIEIGLSWLIGSEHYGGFDSSTSFDIMFGALLLAHGVLKRGHPYRLGKLGTFFGVLFLIVGVTDYFGKGEYSWAILFILLGIVVIVGATTRRSLWLKFQ